MSNIQLVEVSSPDGKGSLYLCPLCPIENAYYNAIASKVMDHMRGNKHFGIAVKHHGWLICKCDDVNCESNSNISNNHTLNESGQQKMKSHRHCPHCGHPHPLCCHPPHHHLRLLLVLIMIVLLLNILAI